MTQAESSIALPLDGTLYSQFIRVYNKLAVDNLLRLET